MVEDYEGEIHGLLGPYRKYHCRYFVTEPFRRDGDLIVARHEVSYVVHPDRTRLRFFRLTSGHILDGDFGVGNGCSRGGPDGAGQRGANELRP